MIKYKEEIENFFGLNIIDYYEYKEKYKDSKKNINL